MDILCPPCPQSLGSYWLSVSTCLSAQRECVVVSWRGHHEKGRLLAGGIGMVTLGVCVRLVSRSCRDKVLQAEWFKTIELYAVRVLGAGSLKSSVSRAALPLQCQGRILIWPLPHVRWDQQSLVHLISYPHRTSLCLCGCVAWTSPCKLSSL